MAASNNRREFPLAPFQSMVWPLAILLMLVLPAVIVVAVTFGAQKQPLPEGWPAGCFSLGYMAFFNREPLMKPLVEHMLATTRRKLRTQQADALREQAAQLEQILHHWEMKP